MKKDLFGIGVKVVMLTGVFFVIINYFGYLLNANQTPTQSNSEENISLNSAKENIETYTNKDVEIVGGAGVAITTSIGTRSKQQKDTPVNVYSDVIDIGYILANKQEAKDELISKNMVSVGEYLNVLKTDVKALLSSATDRSFTLNSYIAQLEYRYKSGVENTKTLVSQRAELVKSYNDTEKKLDTVKTNLGKNFSSFNSKETQTNMDEYLKLKQQSTNAYLYINIIDKFIAYYAKLNAYNKKLLDTLINNKEILVKNTQVVLPDSGTDLLKDLNLIYTESEWKK